MKPSSVEAPSRLAALPCLALIGIAYPVVFGLLRIGTEDLLPSRFRRGFTFCSILYSETLVLFLTNALFFSLTLNELSGVVCLECRTG